jgi:hypothetical protein
MQRSVSPVIAIVVVVIVIAVAVFAWFHFTAAPEPTPPGEGPAGARRGPEGERAPTARGDRGGRRGGGRRGGGRRGGGERAAPGAPESATDTQPGGSE